MKNEIWVVKIGSQLITEKGAPLINSLIKEVSYLMKKKSLKIIWVTSGAIAQARKELNYEWHTLPEKQALSALGQPLLMDLYNKALKAQGLRGGQVLLSYSDFRRKESRVNLCNTIMTLLSWKVLPLLNENDVVATDEIQFGDNDQLSSMIAAKLKVDRLIILTNVDGLYDRDPSKKDAKLLSSLPRVNNKLIAQVASKKKSAMGSGGMVSKLLAAKRALAHGIPTTIVRGSEKMVLTRLARGEELGTTIGRTKEE